MVASHPVAIGNLQSYWIDSTPAPRFALYQPTTDHEVADIVIIGGGIAGITTAYLLQTQGARVTLIEKDQILQGVTGHTTAKITSLHTLIYDKLISRFGEDTARLYGQANQAGLELIAALTQSLSIDCDFLRTTAYTYAETQDDTEKIEKEVKAAQKLGLPASFAQANLPYPTFGAVAFSQQAQFHPRKYLLALAQAFVAAGGAILEDTRVLSLKEDDAYCTLETSRGTLHAERVVVATHYPIYDPALYFTRLSAHRSLVLAMTVEGDVPQGMYITNAESSHSVRNQPTADGETLLLLGGESYKTGQGGDILEKYATLEAFARKYFAVQEIRYHWSTQDNATLDGLPYIGKISPTTSKVYIATGFDGWGMTNGSASGIILSDLLLGRDNAYAEIMNPQRFKPGIAAAASFISENVNVAKEFVSGWLPDGDKTQLTDLAAGEGKIIENKQGKIAISRTSDGSLHAVSAVCTHLGCIVAWNNGEESWDCPCHASRFAPDGTVLHGPATKDLQAISTVDVVATE